MTWFDKVPLPVVFLGTTALLMAGVELGSWFVRNSHEGKKAEHDAPVGSLVTAVLGLLAFILAFTFGMTASRFEERRKLALEEANAIRTVYLEASLIPKREGSVIRQSLREYVDLRLGIKLENLKQRLSRASEIQRQVWAETAALMSEAMPTDLRVQFTTDVIQILNLHQSRLTVGLYYRIPSGVWVSLYILAMISMLAMGYQLGTTGSKMLRGMPVLAVAIALVIYMIADIDRPGEGQFKVEDQTMRDLQKTMQQDSPR